MKTKDQQLLEEAYTSIGLKHVFVLVHEESYEGDSVYGIYTNQKLAEAAAEKIKHTTGYTSIKMVSVNGPADLNYLHND
jgi:hypothetical protein